MAAFACRRPVLSVLKSRLGPQFGRADANLAFMLLLYLSAGNAAHI